MKRYHNNMRDWIPLERFRFPSYSVVSQVHLAHLRISPVDNALSMNPKSSWKRDVISAKRLFLQVLPFCMIRAKFSSWRMTLMLKRHSPRSAEAKAEVWTDGW